MTGRLRAALLVVAAAAIGISAFLVWERHQGGLVACPVGGTSCTVVQHSRYGALLGVPVSTFGLAGAAGLFAVAWVRRPVAAIAAFGLASTGVAFSAYLTWAEAFRIHAYCAWCLSSATLWLAAEVLAGVGAARATTA